MKEESDAALGATFFSLDEQFLHKVASVPLEVMRSTMAKPLNQLVAAAGDAVVSASGSPSSERIEVSPFLSALSQSTNVRVRLGSVTTLWEIPDFTNYDAVVEGVYSCSDEYLRAAFCNAAVQATVEGGKDCPPCALTLVSVSSQLQPVALAKRTFSSDWPVTYFSLLSLSPWKPP